MGIDRIKAMAMAVRYDGPFGKADVERMVASVRAGWTEAERDELAEKALREMIPGWLVVDDLAGAVADWSESVRDSARRSQERRQAQADHELRMKMLWDEEVSTDRAEGGLERRKRLRRSATIDAELGEPKTPELREWLSTPAGEKYAAKHIDHETRRHAAHVADREREEALVKAARAEARAEWTRDLLDVRFTTPAGPTSWGAATLDQHQQRIAVLHRSAVAGIETMKRHELAVRDLVESGARCLAEMVGA
jgi:hypothetical protein